MTTMREDARRRWAAMFAWGSWLIAICLTGVLTYLSLVRPVTAPPTTFQRVGGVFVILMIGTGVAAGTALSRMKLARTITRVFEEGYRFAEDEQRSRANGKHRKTPEA